jgi:opacity protein-like surface antigen
MNRMMAALAAAAALGCGSLDAAAQEPPPEPERTPPAEQEEGPTLAVYWGLYGDYARAVGEFSDYVRHGGGMSGFAALPLGAGSPLALRADAGVLIYGSERQRMCLGNCRIQVDVTTTNTILYLNAGPQLIVPAGRVRPYINTAVGLAAFSTGSQVEGSSGSQEPFASTTHQNDVTFQWLAGAGVVVPFRPGGVGLDVSVRYHGNGQVEYLTKGDIQDNPDGSITITPRRSQANLLTFRIGIAAVPAPIRR